MRNTFIDMLVEYAEKNKDVVLLTGDLGTGCLEKFIERFPDRFFNVGIAEQSMIGIASGLAKEGKKVFCYSICNFAVERPYEFLRNLACYHNLDVKVVGVGAGLEYGALGVTHHATDDIAGLRALENMTIYSPANANECKMAMKDMFSRKGPAYLRLNKKGGERAKDFVCKNIADINQLENGNKLAIVASGSIVSEALLAHDKLKNLGHNVAVFSVPQIKPLNTKTIKFIAEQFSSIFVLEEHKIIGGLGSAVAEQVAELGCATKVFRIGLDGFTCKVGKQDELRKIYNLDYESLVAFIKGRI